MPDTGAQSPPRMALLAPVGATAALAFVLLFDDAIVYWHTRVNWPWRLADLEHLGSAWCNRLLPPAALIVALCWNRPALRQLIVALPLQAIITHLLKWLVGRVRPIHGDESMLFQPLSPIHESWPSGHAALAWTIAFVFASRGSRATSLWVVIALFVCWARLHTYAHFPSDLLGGAMIGWLVALITSAALEPWIQSGSLADLRLHRTGEWRLVLLWLLAVLSPITIALAIGDRLKPVGAADSRQHIETLYGDYLGREADAPGLAAYAARCDDGLPLLAVARDILDSDESRRRLAPLAPEDRVSRLYDLLAHRAPTGAEVTRDVPLVEDLTRGRSRLHLLIMRLTWPPP